jgi:hypothetical protein
MRGQLQAASARLPAARARRRWSAWLIETRRRRRLLQAERLETIERMRREERQARRSGDHAPNLRRLA